MMGEGEEGLQGEADDQAGNNVDMKEALGYIHESTSMEDIVHSSSKQEAKLVDLVKMVETPIELDAAGTVKLEELQLKETGEASSSFSIHTAHHSEETEQGSSPSSYHSTLSEAYGIAAEEFSSPGSNCATHCKAHANEPASELGGLYKGTARSRLYEICAANYWNPPSFVCCKDEGPSHSKLFTYKVTVKVETATMTLLECFSGPRAKKKAAAEHAAEGALWYLQHLGYLPKAD